MIPRRVAASLVVLWAALLGCRRPAPIAVVDAGPPAPPPPPFQGVVDYVSAEPGPIEHGARPSHLVATISGPRCAWRHVSNGVGEPLRILDDDAAKKSRLLDERTKTYTEHEFVEMGGTHSGTRVGNGFVKTGATDIVAGYRCEVATWEMPPDVWPTGTPVTEVCVSYDEAFRGAGLGPFADKLGLGAPWVRSLGGFPLRYLRFAADGTLIMGWEAERVERRAVSDAEVTLPPDYVPAKPAPQPSPVIVY